jgi:poly-gamma-glutamate synthesis protein (capsule biosynthesis protein)
MELLDAIGTDVVELSGDHFKDWGPEAMYYTLQIYNDRNLPYYGGGKDLDDARKPAIFENNGNRIAFIGCNAKPLGYSSASATTPGAVHCNIEWMSQEISRLKKEGYITIATFQHLEYYAYDAKPELKADFYKVAEAGADIVSGSQAHQPHAIEFYGNAFLHYGLGNLFFDQYYEGEAVQDAFLDRHVIYDGKHISTQLLTIKAVDLAQVRSMTTDERNQLLTSIFKASGWTKK